MTRRVRSIDTHRTASRTTLLAPAELRQIGTSFVSLAAAYRRISYWIGWGTVAPASGLRHEREVPDGFEPLDCAGPYRLVLG